jgi:3-oxosteroid 1-dehydrogenase
MPDTRPVVVVGSGAAGLAAALAASGAGADVVVLESAPSIGGTTAMSGGVVWMPGHGRAGRSTAGEDSARDAVTYLAAAGGADGGDVELELVRAFVSDTRRVAGEIEGRSAIQWEVLEHWPDYRGELPGASAGGRSMWPRSLRLAPEIEARVQAAFDQPSPAHMPTQMDRSAPSNDGVVLRGHVRGRALVGGLLTGLVDAGVEIRTGARATRLVLEDGAVVGVVVDGEVVSGRVVLASGGFQHDAALVGEFLAGSPIAPMGPGGCGGTGLRMAMAVDPLLGNTAEGWWMPAMHVPGESVDGLAHYRPLHGERAQPGAILVDRSGRRFVDEAQNYGDVGRAMRAGAAGDMATGAVAAGDMATGAVAAGDMATGAVAAGDMATGDIAYPAAPCWLVFDAAHRARYPVGPLEPGGPDPDWLVRGGDLDELAAMTGMPSGTLGPTVARFNEYAAVGEDPDFGRGSFPYDRWIGDRTAPHPTLAPLCEAPFYALQVHLGCMGTKGGPRTDDRGRVLSAGGGRVPGLYAAGNAAASPFGTATAAGGATLGPALVFGFRAGEAAATDR